MSKLRPRFLFSSRPPLWATALMLAFAFGAREGISIWLSEDTVQVNRIAEEDRRAADYLSQLRVHSVDFQTHAASFAHGILDKVDDVEDRKIILRQNIVAQHAAASVIPDNLSEPAKVAAGNYRDRLTSMKDAMEQADDLMSLAPFWKAASDLLVARDVFFRELQRHHYQVDS